MLKSVPDKPEEDEVAMAQDWSIQEVAQLSGVSSRTLRHYHQIDLLKPSRIGYNGYRYYDAESLARLQRILLLREQGVGLAEIDKVLAGQTDQLAALKKQLDWLQDERHRLERQIRSVQHTIMTMEGGEYPMAEDMFDGFDHTEYRDEVEERWGKQAYADSDRWWRSQSAEEKQQWMNRVTELNRDWIAAAQASGVAADSAVAQELARRHVEWLRGIPGTPAAIPGGDLNGYVLGLAEMYVADERFAANYGGVEGARFVRDALQHYVAQNLSDSAE